MRTILEDLRRERTTIIDAMASGRGWTLKQAQGLAAVHGAIVAFEAVIAEGPTRDQSQPERHRPVGKDGWPIEDK